MSLPADKWRDFPKVELHTHLDCGLSFSAVQRIAPEIERDTYRKNFVAPKPCNDLKSYLQCIDSALELLQTAEALQIAVDDLLHQLAAENVRYAEIRFAPLLHILGKLAPKAIAEIVLEAAAESAHRHGIEVGLIICTLRHFSEEQSLATARLVEKFAGRGVVALDLAADEAGFPLDNHIKAFELVRAAGVNVIALAGEAKGADSVRETVDRLGVSRIGHGVRSIEDRSVVEMLVDRGIHLEVCPTSNIDTNIYPSMEQHSVDALRKLGVSFGINTDARTLSDITLAAEYAGLGQAFAWDEKDFLDINLAAIDASFAPAAVRENVSRELRAAYAPQS